MDAFWISLAVVFVAELGDKSQLMALAFATRYRASQVLLGITVATAVMTLLAVLVGSLLSTALPTRSLGIVGGVAFLGFAAWTLRGEIEEGPDGTEGPPTVRGRFPAVGVGLAFLVAEIGDKTMLATIALAMSGHWAWVWAGSTIGMVGASALAVAVGSQIGSRLSPRLLRVGSAGLFAVFGVLLLVDALRG